MPVDGRPDPARIAETVAGYAEAGATHTALLSVGDGPPLEEFAVLVAEQVRPLVA